MESSKSKKIRPVIANKDGEKCPYIYANEKPLFDKKSQIYAGYESIHLDLSKAFKLLDEYFNKYNDNMLKEAIWNQSILLVGRTFSTGEGRGVKLEQRNFSSEKGLALFLKKIVDIRNRYIAHHGFSGMEKFLTLVSLNPSNKPKEVNAVGMFSITTTSPYSDSKEVTRLKYLITELLKWTEKKLNTLAEKIMVDFSQKDIDYLYEISYKPE